MNKIKIEIGFGATFDKDGAVINNAALLIENCEQKFMREFGSFTRSNTFGGWRNLSGEKFLEAGATLFIIADNTPQIIKSAHQIAAYVKATLNQEAVCLTITPCSFQLI